MVVFPKPVVVLLLVFLPTCHTIRCYVDSTDTTLTVTTSGIDTSITTTDKTKNKVAQVLPTKSLGTTVVQDKIKGEKSKKDENKKAIKPSAEKELTKAKNESVENFGKTIRHRSRRYALELVDCANDVALCYVKPGPIRGCADPNITTISCYEDKECFCGTSKCNVDMVTAKEMSANITSTITPTNTTTKTTAEPTTIEDTPGSGSGITIAETSGAEEIMMALVPMIVAAIWA